MEKLLAVYRELKLSLWLLGIFTVLAAVIVGMEYWLLDQFDQVALFALCAMGAAWGTVHDLKNRFGVALADLERKRSNF